MTAFDRERLDRKKLRTLASMLCRSKSFGERRNVMRTFEARIQSAMNDAVIEAMDEIRLGKKPEYLYGFQVVKSLGWNKCVEELDRRIGCIKSRYEHEKKEEGR